MPVEKTYIWLLFLLVRLHSLLLLRVLDISYMARNNKCDKVVWKDQ